jgi:nitrile hydratase
MQGRSGEAAKGLPGLVSALGKEPIFGPGDRIRISTRSPVGHYRAPVYLRGKTGSVEAEQEGYGRNAGSKLHYFRIAS